MNRQKLRGVTLIELLMVMAILAVLGVLAAPALGKLIERNNASIKTQALTQFLTTARSEAIKRGMIVSVCPVNAAGQCGTNWQAPWVIFVDQDGNRQIDTRDAVLRQIDPFSVNANVTASLSAKRNAFAFNSLGDSHGTFGTVTLCYQKGKGYAHRIIVSRSGRIRSSVDINQDGKTDGGGTAPPSCS